MNVVSEKSIFLDAIDLPVGETRQEFLDQACGNNAQLRMAVEALLVGHQSADNPIDQPVAELPIDQSLFEDAVNRANLAPPLDLTGTQIGPYKLMELIGEGGFGLVYVAEQQAPVRRRVALKIIKPGMDSREIIARFEAERQALAMMAHPNISQVFDAGISSNGRLYFVMELVRGIPITEFCDHQRMTLTGRIELFRDVCAAIQHAHQKGIIHRDVKPSNVLVTLHDAKPVVKVIDFGVAKAIGQRLTDKTIYTRFFAMIGTPAYMSPEQAQFSGLDIDTRGDIYSLGVLLYELLTGTTPFERDRLDSVGYDEMRRIIREEEPVKPSDRITTLGKQLTTVSSQRSAEPRRLTGYVAGDLDWIVLKALEKDRNRRYESASAFSDDLQRFLTEEPINARPPTRRYRLKKYYRRNRLALLTSGAIVAALAIGTSLSLWQALNAITERNQKDVALQEALVAKQQANQARSEVEQFADRLKQANLLMNSGQTYANAGQWAAAYEEYSQAIELQPNYYLVWVQRAQLYAKLNCWDEAAADYESAINLGAPSDEPSWWGAPQLFWYTGRETQYHTIVDGMLKEQTANNTRSWNSIRNALVAPGPAASFEDLANETLVKLEESQRSGRIPPGDRPPRNRAQPATEPGPDPNRRIWPGEEKENRRGLGGPPPPPGRERAGDNRGDWMPRGAQLYVAGWAQLRAGQWDGAIELLERSTREDRGWPGRELGYFPLAIAYHKSGDADNALSALASGQAAIERWLDSLGDQPSEEPQIPWFDAVEYQLLSREAVELIHGSVPPEDSRMRELQTKNLELLGVTNRR